MGVCFWLTLCTVCDKKQSNNNCELQAAFYCVIGCQFNCNCIQWLPSIESASEKWQRDACRWLSNNNNNNKKATKTEHKSWEEDAGCNCKEQLTKVCTTEFNVMGSFYYFVYFLWDRQQQQWQQQWHVWGWPVLHSVLPSASSSSSSFWLPAATYSSSNNNKNKTTKKL